MAFADHINFWDIGPWRATKRVSRRRHACHFAPESSYSPIQGSYKHARVCSSVTMHPSCSQVHKFAEGMKDINEFLQLRPTYFEAFLCRARIMVGLELFETAAEDFRAALEHGKVLLNGAEKRGIEAELEDAEQRARLQKDKEEDHYATLGECT